jgi:signal transduction histidine kinase
MVLLVDDQSLVAEAVRRALADAEDIDFHYCSSSYEALDQAIRIKPTVILQDLVMPHRDGLDLLRLYRANPATQDVPVIVLSVEEDAKVKAKAFELGANDYLVKLPDRVELLARIRYHSHAYLNRIQRDEANRALRKSQRQLVDGNVALMQLSEMLRQRNEVLKAAERLARMGSWAWDIATDRFVWSDMLHEMFVWDRATPAPCFEELRAVFTPESFTLLRGLSEFCRKAGRSYSVDLEAVKTSGERFFVHAKGQAARDTSGEIVSLFGTIHDITEQRRLNEIAQKAAVLEERARIAGEIHDSLAQAFAAIVLQTEIAEELLAGPNFAEPRGNIAKARELARFGLAEARRSTLTLRPSHALELGLAAALQQLCRRATVDDLLVCETRITGESRPLDPLVEHELFRIAQEALNNAVRHAQAKRIAIELSFQAEGITMTIQDNGRGFPVGEVERTEGFGLLTMRERAQKIGGTLEIGDNPSGGARIVARVPDRPRPDQAA